MRASFVAPCALLFVGFSVSLPAPCRQSASTTAAAMSSSTMSSSLLLGTFAVMMTMERFLQSI